MTDTKTHVLLYIPNLIDYLRLAMIITAWVYIDQPIVFLPLYITQIFLDFFDGYFAKLFDQVSAFGAWLDVVLDNFGRGLLWCYLFRAGFIITMVEWLAFSCTQKYGAKWKEWFNETPFLVRHVFKNNFKTFIGISAISAGLQGLPIILYIWQHFETTFDPTWSIIFKSLIAYCSLGRFLCLYVESWVIYRNIKEMVITHSKQ